MIAYLYSDNILLMSIKKVIKHIQISNCQKIKNYIWVKELNIWANHI